MFKSKSALAEIAEVVLLALGLYLVINFAVQTVHVVGLSMYPTLNNDDYLIATKLDYRFHNPDRGDIIIMRDPFDPSKDFIKRVIGLPGDELLIRDGKVFINGKLLEEPYLNPEPWTINANYPPAAGTGPGSPVKLSPGNYFVMGDNRNRSSDSRVFGQVKRDQIEARAWVRVLPVDKFGAVDHKSGRLISPDASNLGLPAVPRL